MVRNISIYGKGGIGKSTIASHLAASWGLQGYKVALIGCDPKRDSTLLLTGNRRIKPVLNAIRDRENIENCFVKGYADVLCAEIGGPEPGVGCAGRGLLLAFEQIDKHNLLDGLDIIVYDVPGDVVCGGFVVPMKRKDSEVYVVTSGEYLSIYAANNILKGAKNAGARVGGIILNSRFNLDTETKIVSRFVKAVNTRVVGVVPFIEKMKECEKEGKTLFEMECEEKNTFVQISKEILNSKDFPEVSALSDEELLRVVTDF